VLILNRQTTSVDIGSVLFVVQRWLASVRLMLVITQNNY
jgi:hypothetical protein